MRAAIFRSPMVPETILSWGSSFQVLTTRHCSFYYSLLPALHPHQATSSSKCLPPPYPCPLLFRAMSFGVFFSTRASWVHDWVMPRLDCLLLILWVPLSLSGTIAASLRLAAKLAPTLDSTASSPWHCALSGKIFSQYFQAAAYRIA